MRRAVSRSLSATVFAALLVGACGGGDPQDIREWMQEQSKDMRGKVPDLPQIKPLEVLAYEPADLSSPFSVDKVFADDTKMGARAAAGGGPKPVNPDAQPMVKYPLESIRLVGTIKVGKDLRALVVAEREPVRQVRVGDYLGQNNGRITAIEPATDDSDGRITLKEIVLDKGVWIERESRLPQQDKGDRK